MPSSPSPALRRFIGAVDDEWQMFSDNPDDYEIGLPIGFGATSIVYASRYVPKDESTPVPCALKVVNLDKLPLQSLRLLRRETQLMSLSKHPNLLRVRGSWTTGHHLHIALRLMNAGSAADVMRYGWPGGMEEDVVKCILKQALEGLNYLHINGFIHRDIKAANLLIDDDGTVLLGDLGVAASLCDEEPIPIPSGSGQKMNFDGTSSADNSRLPTQAPSKKLGKRKSFVGTPCWMAPELISGKQYDAKADIWSFGITAIELTQGRAPRSRETPARVLLKTVQDAPPEFARESGNHKFSKAFKEIVEACLAKDPSRRPSAAELLDTPFFKGAKRKNYLVNAILKDLPPLIHRQERRAKTSSPLTAASRNSMSSWDFSVELPHTPSAHIRTSLNSAHSTYFSSTFPQHSHHSNHHTLIHPDTSRLDDLDENQCVDALERHRAAQRERISSELHDGDDERSSVEVESSVFDLDEAEEESDPTTPELVPTSMDNSSVATTPLSCSPATALDMQMQQEKKPIVLSMQTTGKPTPVSTRNRSNSKPIKPTSREGVETPHSPTLRRGSSPASTLDRTNLSSLSSLKRIASASGLSSSKMTTTTIDTTPSSTPPPSQSPSSRGLSPARTSSKESRWRKLMRGGSKGSDESTTVPSSKDGGERRKSTLGRILERTGK
ncbi:kinase-like protein [Fomitiporia mediterranea MF3/22]|uniref:kinase-like protein n=1 Tax=Fomitiporia mediterranea (strain MF3/22) TaxID=694068 RepID=UPI0004408CF2|nr:kinase-like protein [Fomitiporia mediterranea MF3/22]EJD04402.1 kinase-like protein [Fomitiporia mediterranea MF3/22]